VRPRQILLRALPGLGLMLAGLIVLLLASDSTAGGVAGLIAIGLGGVFLVSLLFYEIGLSEDRDREREDDLRARRRPRE
jgi:hypothetical protein